LEVALNQFKELFTNYMLVSAILSWIGAQILKVFTGMFKERTFNIFVLLFSNGGMPSSHSAVVCGLSTASIIQNGTGSPITAICLIMSMVVMNDALGVRYETGKQSKIINKIVKEIFSGSPEEVNTGLKELVGHTPFQVLIGAFFGVAVAILMKFIML
jgi:acid phosphatase family membrane protein YuiD